MSNSLGFDVNNNIPIFRPQPVDVNDVILIIKHLSNSNAKGSDGIPKRFINDSLCDIVFYITFIVNTSIVTGVYPSN